MSKRGNPRPTRRIPASAPSISSSDRKMSIEPCERGGSPHADPTSKTSASVSSYVKVRYGIATTSGTTALHLALVALGVGPGDEVLIPDLTMVACADAVLYTGAKPVFVDIEPRTLTLDPVDLRRKLTRRSRAVMPVHLYGHPARMAEILEISRRYNLLVIEDAAEAHGALYSGLPVGSFGHASCFSFFSNKIITTGEGGMVVTNSLAVAEKAQRFRDLAFAGKRGTTITPRLASTIE